MEMLTVNTENIKESSSAISESAYDEFINALFDRAFGPYEVNVGGEDS